MIAIDVNQWQSYFYFPETKDIQKRYYFVVNNIRYEEII